MTKRNVFRIQLTASAKKAIQKTSDDTGVTQVSISSKLHEWFASQPAEIKTAVLGLYPDSVAPDVATLLLKRMAAKAKHQG